MELANVRHDYDHLVTKDYLQTMTQLIGLSLTVSRTHLQRDTKSRGPY